jgi:membrane protein YqaA with SNARE-associated domain
MLRRLYDWVMRLAASRHAVTWLALIAFCEGVFFPIPVDVMLMPVVLADRARAWRYAAITTVASVLGGSTGFLLGSLFKPVGLWILDHTGGALNAEAVRQWIVLLVALPIPYKLTAITSGLFQVSFPLFLAASLAIRGARYFAVAGLMKFYGEPIREFVEKRLALVLSVVAVAAVLLLLGIRQLAHMFS